MITAFDCHYTDSETSAAACCVAVVDAPEIDAHLRLALPAADDYVPGEFYKRELPALLALIEQIPWDSEVFIIDGYVDLTRERAGLGRYVFNELNEQMPVIGVAKNAFEQSDTHTELRRGASEKPLFITAAGMEQSTAVTLIKDLYGEHRLPMLLKKVDHYARHLCS